MAKRQSREELEDRAGRKLAKAQAEFQLAQEKRAVAITKGEQMIERARSRAARLLTRSTKRVERRAAAVARAEARLAAVRSRGRLERSPWGATINAGDRPLPEPLDQTSTADGAPQTSTDDGFQSRPGGGSAP